MKKLIHEWFANVRCQGVDNNGDKCPYTGTLYKLECYESEGRLMVLDKILYLYLCKDHKSLWEQDGFYTRELKDSCLPCIDAFDSPPYA